MSKSEPSKIILKDAFKDKIILICDPFHTSNSLLKKILTNYGADFPNIHTTQSVEHSLEIIEGIKPHYIFSVHRDKKNQTCEKLFHLHCKLKPDRSNHSFFLLTQESNAYYAAAFKRQVFLNGFAFEPFTLESLEKAVINMLNFNHRQNGYLISMRQGLEFFFKEDYNNAVVQFSNAQNQASFDPADALYYQGLCYSKQYKNQKALERWYLALDYCQHHYLTLRELFLFHHRDREYEKAYHCQVALIKYHPLDPMLIPHFILISVRMKKYGEIYDLALLFQKLNYQVKETERSIAAGLVMSGRYFIANKDKELGKKILLKAAEIADPTIEIFKNISTGLLDGDYFVDAYELIGKKAEENPNNMDFKILEIDLLFKAGEFPKCLTLGSELLQKDIYHPDLFHSVIMSSIKIGRNKGVIEDMIKRAMSLYPDQKEKYVRILAHYF